MQMQEIERKWLVDGFPPGEWEREVWMEQGYLCFEPVTVRIRRTLGPEGCSYALTLKGEGTLCRTEVEPPLSAEQYEALHELLLAPPATKRHRVYRLPGGEALEVSLVDEGEPGSFYYAEVEFDSLEAAAGFVPPPYLGREVTEEPGWSMSAYCRRKAGMDW